MVCTLTFTFAAFSDWLVFTCEWLVELIAMKMLILILTACWSDGDLAPVLKTRCCCGGCCCCYERVLACFIVTSAATLLLAREGRSDWYCTTAPISSLRMQLRWH